MAIYVLLQLKAASTGSEFTLKNTFLFDVYIKTRNVVTRI